MTTVFTVDILDAVTRFFFHLSYLVCFHVCLLVVSIYVSLSFFYFCNTLLVVFPVFILFLHLNILLILLSTRVRVSVRVL